MTASPADLRARARRLLDDVHVDVHLVFAEALEPELVQAVAAIQAHDWVEQIEEAQLRFRQHSATRIDKMAVEEAKSCSTTEARRLGSAISKLFRLIESEVEFYNRAELNELVVKLNKIIEGYTTLQKQRAARAKRPKSDDTSQQPTA